MTEDTAALASGASPELDPAERRLLAAMPLHAITSVRGETGHLQSVEDTGVTGGDEEVHTVKPGEHRLATLAVSRWQIPSHDHRVGCVSRLPARVDIPLAGSL
jgi:hypothetical protein